MRKDGWGQRYHITFDVFFNKPKKVISDNIDMFNKLRITFRSALKAPYFF